MPYSFRAEGIAAPKKQPRMPAKPPANCPPKRIIHLGAMSLPGSKEIVEVIN